MPIIASCCQHFKTMTHRHRVTAFFVLFHHISYWTFRVLWCVLIMDEDLRSHGYWNYSSQILVPLVIQLTSIATPKGQSSHSLLMLLEIFHSGSISDIHSKNASSTITNKQFSLPIVQNHCCQLMCTKTSVYA